MSTLVIGAGMAGMAAADRLCASGLDVVVVDKRATWGGHTTSLDTDGFVFDEGPHVSFTKDDKVRDLFTAGAVEVEEFKARITNAFRGRWITHPAQCHLYGLDPDLVTRCVTDFVRAQMSPPEVRTYADWCVAMFGKTFAETFPFAYTRKYWTVEAADMSTDWVGSRMYPPKIDDVVRGALVPEQPGDFHYLSTFRYPSRGGYQSFMRAMYRPELLRLDARVVSVDLERRQVRFADGTSLDFDSLVSTMPLPDLVEAIVPGQVPAAVRDASKRLLCTSLVLIDVAVKRRDLFDHHWFYVYDEDISIVRGHFPHMLAAANAPEGHGAIQLEVYHSPHRPLPCSPADLSARVVDELARLGILESRDDVLWARHREVKYANVVFTHDRGPAMDVILPWLKARGVVLAGRYGEWAYYWTDDAVRAGWAAADSVLARHQTIGPPA
jgi:protoporphyrinogen oxidase